MLNDFFKRPTGLYPTFKPYIEQAITYAEINNPLRLALFLANCSHETASFTKMRENMNYSPEGLVRVWPNKFKGKDGKPNAKAYELCKDRGLRAVNIGNYVYANRFGNGDFESGDGYAYRAGGLAGLTFKDNYLEFDKGWNMNLKFALLPHLIETPYYACMTAAYFWKTRDLNSKADTKSINVARKIWNGGSNGLVEVVSIYNRILPILEKDYGSRGN